MTRRHGDTAIRRHEVVPTIRNAIPATGTKVAGPSIPEAYWCEWFLFITRTRNRASLHLDKVTMIVTRFLNSRLSICLQRVVEQLLGFFRFTETDAVTVLSAYGFNAFEIDRLPSERLAQAKPFDKLKASAPNRKVGRRKSMALTDGPIPIGIHQDFRPGSWRRTLSKQIGSKKP